MNFGAKNAAQSGVLSTAMGTTLRRPETKSDKTAEVSRFTPTAEGEETPAPAGGREAPKAKQSEQQQPQRRVVRRRVRRRGADGTRGTTSTGRSGETSGRQQLAQTQDTGSNHMSRRVPDKLNEGATLTRSSIGFEQANSSQSNLSANGQRKTMLNNLARMAKLNYVDTHTGDDSFAYPRREGRMIVMALAGLQAGGARQQTKKSGESGDSSSSTSTALTTGEYSLKESTLAKVTAIFDPPPTPPPGYEPVELVA